MHSPLPMDDGMFQHWQEMLEERIGITIPVERRSFLVTSLDQRMSEVGCHSYGEYMRLLEDGPHGAVEWELLVDHLTVHETRFYRDSAALQLLEDQFFRFIGRDDESRTNIDVWSVGCATGEEPYSLAIALDDYLLNHELENYFSVTATDISRASLATARQGIYHRNRLRNLPVKLLRRYFLPYDLDHYRLSRTIRDRVCFTLMNLVDVGDASLGKMDIIFCQNVLIYFKRERRAEIANSLVEHLRPGGLLILGAGELVKWRHERLVQIPNEDVVAFRRLPDEESAA